MRQFFVCSVGEPDKDYTDDNLERIIKNSAFCLHEDTIQKGLYSKIEPGDILFLKYKNKLIAYGESIGNEKIDDIEGWSLLSKVEGWFFYDKDDCKKGTNNYGISWETTEGSGQMGTVKGVNCNYGIKKMKEIDSSSDLIKVVVKQYYEKKREEMINKYIKLLNYKKQIILQGPPGTGKTKLAKELAKSVIKSNKIDNKTISVKNLTKDYIKSNLTIGQKIKAKNDSDFEVVGLEEKVVLLKSDTSKPWKPSYNKIIESFDNKLWQIKGRTGGFKSYEDALARYFYEEHFEKIVSTEEKVYHEEDYLTLTQFHPSYTYEDFVRGIVTVPSEDGQGVLYEVENKILVDFAQRAFNDLDNNYVLIIDEINRANLSSVLGELIYALEYRDEEVDSMYGSKEDKKLVLPSNLYIIGTMNTADRSVGHIDYAIRRRFAFVDVLPKDLSGDSTVTFDSELFNAVKELFTTDEYVTRSPFLSSEFDPKDVALGHSYFIDKLEEGGSMTLRLEYEIKPILREYIKDGILIGKSIEQEVEKLETKLQS